MYMCLSPVEYPEALKSASDKVDLLQSKPAYSTVNTGSQPGGRPVPTQRKWCIFGGFLLVHTSSGMTLLYALRLSVRLPSLNRRMLTFLSFSGRHSAFHPKE